MSREFRVFEVDKYGNKFFVCRHSTKESAEYFLRRVIPESDQGSYMIEDENGDRV